MAQAVTLRLDGSGCGRVEALWRALATRGVDDSRLTLGYAPHVTLAVFPDEVPVGELTEALRALARSFGPVPLRFYGYGVFPGHGGPDVVWLSPMPTDRLRALQTALCVTLHGRKPMPHWEPATWVPHVTLAEGPGVAARALEALCPLWDGPFAASCDRVELVRFPPVRVLEGLPLDGEA